MKMISNKLETYNNNNNNNNNYYYYNDDINDNDDEDSIMQGKMKQQCLDPVTGLYDWVVKEFRLDIYTGLLELVDKSSKLMEPILVSSAKYAKEWSAASSSIIAAGSGFDIVWCSGSKILSFMAESDENCYKWVQAVNNSISIALKTQTLGNLKDVKDVFRIPPEPPINKSKLNSDSNEIPLPDIPSYLSDKLTNNIKNNKVQYKNIINDAEEELDEDEVEEVTDVEIQSPYLNNIQKENTKTVNKLSKQNIDINQNSIKKKNEQNNKENINQPNTPVTPFLMASQGLNISDIPANSMGSSVNVSPGGSESTVVSNSSSVLPYRDTIIRTVKEVDSPLIYKSKSSSTQDEKIQEDLRTKCEHLSLLIEKERSESSIAKEQMLRLQNELDSRTHSFESHLHSIWDKEKTVIKDIREEAEKRILRISNDNNSLHEAEMKATKEQHKREISCLKEELSIERKKYNDFSIKDSELRSNYDSKEKELRNEISILKDNYSKLFSENSRLKETSKVDLAFVERDRETLMVKAENRIAKLEQEKEAILIRSQNEMSRKIEQMTSRFEGNLRDMEVNIRDTVIKQQEGECMLEITKMQKKCTKEIEIIRTDERKKAAMEIERIRVAYSTREKQTSDDLMELEKCHNNRILRLEKQLNDEKTRNDRYEGKIQELISELKKAESFSKQQSETHLKQLESHSNEAQKLSLQLEKAHLALQDAESCERNYRDELARVLEESRLQRAELLEARRQASNGTVQANEWRNAVKESDLSNTVAATSLQIANQEISMLDHQLQRLKQENDSLNQALNRSDKLVYGTINPTQSLTIPRSQNQINFRVVSPSKNLPITSPSSRTKQPQRGTSLTVQSNKNVKFVQSSGYGQASPSPSRNHHQSHNPEYHYTSPSSSRFGH